MFWRRRPNPGSRSLSNLPTLALGGAGTTTLDLPRTPCDLVRNQALDLANALCSRGVTNRVQIPGKLKIEPELRWPRPVQPMQDGAQVVSCTS